MPAIKKIFRSLCWQKAYISLAFRLEIIRQSINSSKNKLIMANETETTTLAAAEQELEAAIAKLGDALKAGNKSAGDPLPDSVMRGIVNLINQAKSAFAPYDNPLTPADRKRLIGTGYKNYGFIERAYASAAANPTLMPSYLNANTFKIDIDDFSRKRNLE
jgi:hypothetical protein